MDEIKKSFEYLADNAGKLTTGQLEFVRSLQKQFRQKKELSEKQKNVLNEIRKNIPISNV